MPPFRGPALPRFSHGGGTLFIAIFGTFLHRHRQEIEIEDGMVNLHVTFNGVDVFDAPVYLFTDSGSYLGRSQRTDASGHAEFLVPAKAYKFRVDNNGTQYWSGVLNVTNNLRPVRFDGVPPVPEREEKRLAGLEGLVGIISRAVVGYTPTPNVYYFLNVHLGTPQLMFDSTGTVVWEARYKPFGEAQVHSASTVANNFRFPGQYYDSETGLHYNYHRDYQPGIGRYVEPDPIAFDSVMNLYSYVQNNPINAVDPLGLLKLCIAGKIEESDWTKYLEGTIEYMLRVTFFDILGPVGMAQWTKTQTIYENKTLGRQLLCYDSCTGEVINEYEIMQTKYREREEIETRVGTAYRIFAGGDITKGDQWWTRNPWTGQTVTGRMQ